MRIVPSQVVTFINSAFAELEGADPARLWLKMNSRGKVAGLLALIDALAPEHLAALAPDDQYRWTIALTEVQDAIAQWSAGVPGHQLGVRGGGKPQILVLRDILRTCPDDAVTVQPAQLAFLADSALQTTLALDISTSRSALANGEYKAAAVMAGSVAEALLLWAVTQRAQPDITTAADACRARGENVNRNDPTHWLFWELICVASGLGLIDLQTRAALDIARNFRNLIHPGRAQRTGERPTLGTAHLAVGAMMRLVEELS